MHILHAPSVKAHFLEGGPYLHYRSGEPALNALSFAIFFAATSRLSETDSGPLAGSNKGEVLARFKLATEISLAQAELITTTDITVLQAFVIYIVSEKSNDDTV